MTTTQTTYRLSVVKRAFSLLLVCCMLFGYVGTEARAAAVTNYSFGKTTSSGLNVRDKVGGLTLIQLNKNVVVQVLQTLKDSTNNTWYAIYYAPTSTTGYVLSSYINLMSAAESNAYAASHPSAISPTSIPSTTGGTDPHQILGYVETLASGTNLRDKANGGVIAKVDRALTFPYVGKESAAGYQWYRVYVQPYGYGYLRGDYVRETAITSSSVPVVPHAPAPSSFGSITMTTDKVNIRATASLHGTRLGRVYLGNTFILQESPTENDGYTWYKISANSITGYVRGDMAKFNNDASPQTLPAPGVTSMSGFGHVVTSLPSVSLRAAPSEASATLLVVGINQHFPLTSTPIVNGFYTWYPVNVNGTAGYLRNDAVQYFPAGSIITATPPPGGGPGTPSNRLVTIMDKVNLRVSPRFGTKAPHRVSLGTVFPYSRTTTVEGRLWYKILYNNTELWVLGTMVRVLGSAEIPNITPAPGTTATPVPPTTPSRYVVTTKKSVNLRNAPGGKTIGKIPTKGTILDMLSSTTSRNYTWYEVRHGVTIGYVRGDVVALSDSSGNQTVPPTTAPPGGGGGGGGSSTFQLYKPVQKIDWNSGTINRIWPRGSSMPVMDVRTGKSFMMYRWAGGSHVDGEPLTKADTATLCSIYGVSKASDITSRKHYHRRPMWVTINGVTYAASLYGVPHNPAGNVIKNNDYDGQMCLHFLNSRLHSSNKVDKDHMAAIEEAFNKGK